MTFDSFPLRGESDIAEELLVQIPSEGIAELLIVVCPREDQVLL